MALGEPPSVSRAATIVAGNLRVDWATAEVLRAFGDSGVKTLLVKGPSVVRWLYEAHDPRSYIDCDLLVRPGDLSAAEHVLENRGFSPNVYEREMPECGASTRSGGCVALTGRSLTSTRPCPGLALVRTSCGGRCPPTSTRSMSRALRPR